MNKLLIGILLILFFSSCDKNDDYTWEQPEPKSIAQITTFNELLDELKTLLPSDAQVYLDNNFIEICEKFDFPVVNGDSVIFVYKGEANSIEYSGDFNYWGQQSANLPLVKYRGSDLFILRQKYEADARLEYEYIVDGTAGILDPLNPNYGLTGWGKHSELRMSEYPEQPEVECYEDIPHGTVIKDLSFAGKVGIEGQVRDVIRKYHVYLPPTYDTNQEYRCIYFQDGKDYIKSMEINNVLDYMIHHKEIEPIIAIFCDYHQVSEYEFYRNEDYITEDKDVYLSYLVHDFIPFIDATYSTVDSKEGRTIAGLSNSGAFSIYAASEYPSVFSNVLSQSGALNVLYNYQGLGEDLGDRIASVDLPVRLYLHVGTYEGWHRVNQDFVNALDQNNSVIDYQFETHHQGHALYYWRDVLRESLVWLLGN
ncbi:alpha/beta hydrolase-fold protein [Marinifilum caeruleilacunae]|uniref:Esterase n=1 Tax=Marinifilum caeruleilacunae TaxID=2499076 RepID=A0ABX1WXX3_9BACT|nr:alpha/beta hydrolase-fold protein [Marinifilum caeruleilacunae]NOU60924.1 hypothetical protein [Marinifilum caeruleilacunae]